MSLLYQTDFPWDSPVNKYGCYFMSLAYYGNKIGNRYTVDSLIKIWGKAVKLKIISGDLNNDGDVDDAGESIILDPNGLCRLLDLPLRYLDKHFPVETPISPNQFVIAPWYNPRTKYIHFVVGTSRPVEYDPIRGGSVTVREGWPQSLRIYEVTA